MSVTWEKQGRYWEACVDGTYAGLLGRYPKGDAALMHGMPCWFFCSSGAGSETFDISLTLEEAQTVSIVFWRMGRRS
jgi:hypothetical protein